MRLLSLACLLMQRCCCCCLGMQRRNRERSSQKAKQIREETRAEGRKEEGARERKSRQPSGRSQADPSRQPAVLPLSPGISRLTLDLLSSISLLCFNQTLSLSFAASRPEFGCSRRFHLARAAVVTSLSLFFREGKSAGTRAVQPCNQDD